MEPDEDYPLHASLQRSGCGNRQRLSTEYSVLTGGHEAECVRKRLGEKNEVEREAYARIQALVGSHHLQ